MPVTCRLTCYVYFIQAFVNAPSVLIPPIHLVIATYLIYLELGWSAFLTIAFVVVYVILQVTLGRLHTHWRYSIKINLIFWLYADNMIL